MVLCSILRVALSASLGTVVQIAIFLLQNSNISRVIASMPPGAEDEIILIEHLPGRRVHLQDFFWTGLEDAPPWVDPNQGLTIHETKTVVHTVTVYSPPGEQEPSDNYHPECVTCIQPTPRLDDDDDQSIGVLIGEDPGPRYWLLTVLRPGEAVPPKIELRLARLYRTAFSRQQQRHLGLLSTDLRSRRNALSRALIGRKSVPKRFGTSSQENVAPREETAASRTTVESPDSPDDTTERSSSSRAETEASVSNLHDDKSYFSNVSPIKSSMSMIEIPRPKMLPTFDLDTTIGHEKPTKETLTQKIIKKLKDDTKHVSSEKEIVDGSTIKVDSQSTTSRYDLNTVTDSNEQLPKSELTSKLLDSSESKPSDDVVFKNRSSNNEDVRSKLRLADNAIPGVVKVRMQNTSVIESGATRLIYSVHLDDKPVPAETAARDMALLSPQEVALELGAPVIIQSEPYLKESRPLALSRKRDIWLLISAASAGIVLLILILAGLLLVAKRKRAHSAIVAPPNKSILKKEREFATATPGFDNAAFSTSETEIKTDGTSQRQTPRTLSRTPITPDTPDSMELDVHEISSDNDEELKKTRGSPSWSIQEHPTKRTKTSHVRMARTTARDQLRTPDSMDSAIDRTETLESLENSYVKREESTASPRSYLSMLSCKQFPSMRSVEPLSRVLEPVMVKHLDMDSPELMRHDKDDNGDDTLFLARSSSVSKDPGTIGPIVWNLNKQMFSTEGNDTSETDVGGMYHLPSRPVGRARRRLHELLEDSFSLFGSRDHIRIKESPQTTSQPSTSVTRTAPLSEIRGKSAHVSPITKSTMEISTRPRTSLPHGALREDIPETGQAGLHPRGAWGSRPLSAGPFHRPEVDTRRILTEGKLPPDDPAVPLIASIKKELEKFS
ncbi:uncharacterized protein LOC109856414 [Pseudomyrmex gracilis]|uniref:uncharacterized protein LOC109856414 n=1 Tax=Pseudomyrmex gracilis TaxID=219809 RepID=UPI000995BA14|nr:uncharacterized protein LOC109856414 [Pseudomyrmex gracilis]